jgi:glutathione S-transferase
MLVALNNLPVRPDPIDLMKGQQKEDWFLRMNPCHSVPTYRASNGYALWESNAILRFLVNSFPQQLQQWYPIDPHVRGKIDTALDWRQTTLYQHTSTLGYPLFGWSSDTSGDSAALVALEEDWKILRYFLGGFPFIGGMHPCIADISILSAIKIIDCRTDIKIADDILSYIGRLEHLLPPRLYANVWGKYDEFAKTKRGGKPN